MRHPTWQPGPNSRCASPFIRRVDSYLLPVYSGADSGDYTLRDAIDQANEYYAPDGWTILLGDGFTSDNGGPVPLASSAGDHGVGDSAFLVTGNVTIDGSSVPGFTIQRDANGRTMRLFRVTDGGSLTIRSTVLDGGVASHGGVLLNEGALTLDQSTVQNGSGEVGGGVFNEGTLETDTATFTQNAASSYGGALYNRNGTAVIHGSTLGNNTAPDGGGVGLFGDGDHSLVQLFDTAVNNPGAAHDLSATVTGSGSTVLTASGATTVAVPDERADCHGSHRRRGNVAGAGAILRLRAGVRARFQRPDLVRPDVQADGPQRPQSPAGRGG